MGGAAGAARVRRVRSAPEAWRAWKRAVPGAPPLYSLASRSPSAHCNMSCTLQAWPQDSPSAGASAEVLLALWTRVVTWSGVGLGSGSGLGLGLGLGGRVRVRARVKVKVGGRVEVLTRVVTCGVGVGPVRVAGQ